MHGIDPNDPKAAEKLAATVAKRQGTEAEQSQAMNALKLATARMEAIRSGDVAPMSPVAIEGQAAADGAADRAAKRTLAEAQANAISMKTLGGLMGKEERRNIKTVRGDGWVETLVEVLPDGTYRKLTEAGAEPPAPVVGVDAKDAAKEALKRYHEGGWLGAGKWDREPLRKLTPEALRAASIEGGMAVPDLTDPQPVQAPVVQPPVVQPPAVQTPGDQARAALQQGLTGKIPASPVQGGPEQAPPVAGSQPWTGAPPEVMAAVEPRVAQAAKLWGVSPDRAREILIRRAQGQSAR